MKKILFFIFPIFVAYVCLISCSIDGHNATASVTYVGLVDSIKYTDPNDTVWTNNISEAIAKMKITKTPFTTSDTVESSMQSYALQNCNLKAGNKFDKLLKTVTLDEVKKTIFNTHGDSLVKLGYTGGAESLPIDKFTLYTSLWSYFSSSMVYYWETVLE